MIFPRQGPFLQSLVLSHAVYTDGSLAPALPPLLSQRWDRFNPPLRLRNIYTDRKGREWPTVKSHVWGMDDVTFSECHHQLSPSETEVDPINHFYWDFIYKHLTASTSKGN